MQRPVKNKGQKSNMIIQCEHDVWANDMMMMMLVTQWNTPHFLKKWTEKVF